MYEVFLSGWGMPIWESFDLKKTCSTVPHGREMVIHVG